LNLTSTLARRGLTRLPFGGEPPQAALTPAFATRISECLRDLRAGKVSSVLITGAPEAGHRRIIGALLERFARDGHMVATLDAYPDTGEEFLQELLKKWGLEVEEGSHDELKALLDLFIGHQAGKRSFAYVCLPADEVPPLPVQQVAAWLAGLRYGGEFTVRLVLLGERGDPLPEWLRGGSAETDDARGLQHFEAPGLEPVEVEHYIHVRLSMAGVETPAQMIAAELCRLVAAYSDGSIPLVDQLMLATLELAASQEGAWLVGQHHVERAAESLGLDLQSESVTADASVEEAAPEEALLVFSAGGQVTHEICLSQPRMVMGREGDCDIPLDSRFISRFQCLFMQTRRGWYVLDLASTNGTFVNSRRVREHLLRTGDVIAIGRHQIRFVQDQQVVDADSMPEYLSTAMLVSNHGMQGGDDSGLHALPAPR
jgi:hypothetical protein